MILLLLNRKSADHSLVLLNSYLAVDVALLVSGQKA